jgi:hypothetical protein
LWTHPRGGVHYDVMVTIILAFIFLTPRTLFRDAPKQPPTSTVNSIVVENAAPENLVYWIPGSFVKPGESDPKEALAKQVEAVSGTGVLTRYEAFRDGSGKVFGYRVWAHRSSASNGD